MAVRVSGLRNSLLQGESVSNGLQAGSVVENSLKVSPSGSSDSASADDLSRNVYGILGVPIDVLDFGAALQAIELAVEHGKAFLVSTLNVNFLMISRDSARFRQSLLMSDLCVVDGMPIVWIARLLGVPVSDRIAGSDLFDALRFCSDRFRRLRVFLFGGREGVAATVSKALNAQPGGMECVGILNPGFGSVEEMSKDHIVNAINSSQADLLAVFLSAEKAQAWLLDNHDRVQVPVRAQFGATINIQAGTIKRAPRDLRRWGFEWLWRIKEEPYLWRRYAKDGTRLLYLLLTAVVPLAIRNLWKRFAKTSTALSIERSEDHKAIIISLSGNAVARHVEPAISCFQDLLKTKKEIFIDISKLRDVDPRFFGLFLMLEKQIKRQGGQLIFSGVSPLMRRLFRLNGFAFLLDAKA
jgi:N-acetylglucosaminyldiphosphoundecaprenol N-acetyl-beta-D-mannosaminyltransferase